MSIQEKYFGFKLDHQIFPDRCFECNSKEKVQLLSEFDLRFFPELKDFMLCSLCLQKKYESDAFVVKYEN